MEKSQRNRRSTIRRSFLTGHEFAAGDLRCAGTRVIEGHRTTNSRFSHAGEAQIETGR